MYSCGVTGETCCIKGGCECGEGPGGVNVEREVVSVKRETECEEGGCESGEGGYECGNGC